MLAVDAAARIQDMHRIITDLAVNAEFFPGGILPPNFVEWSSFFLKDFVVPVFLNVHVDPLRSLPDALISPLTCPATPSMAAVHPTATAGALFADRHSSSPAAAAAAAVAVFLSF